jgi:hypothetical protein
LSGCSPEKRARWSQRGLEYTKQARTLFGVRTVLFCPAWPWSKRRQNAQRLGAGAAGHHGGWPNVDGASRLSSHYPDKIPPITEITNSVDILGTRNGAVDTQTE